MGTHNGIVFAEANLDVLAEATAVIIPGCLGITDRLHKSNGTLSSLHHIRNPTFW